ncbi:type VII secretion target [Nocardia sp. NPDC052278]|uniref:type VII secretion target n=1 Tax=unclassified Nocardia TaxID=2637762 RepID=UPI0036A092C6
MGEPPASSNRLSVVPEQVRDVGKYVYELAEKLCTALDSATTDVDAVANGSWTGGLAAEFADGWSDVRDGGGQIITALAAMAEKLGVTAETYQTLDESNASTLNTSSLDLP